MLTYNHYKHSANGFMWFLIVFCLLKLQFRLLLWYEYAVNRWCKKISSKSSSKMFIEQTTKKVNNVFDGPAQIDQDENEGNITGLKTIQRNNKQNEGKKQTTSMEKMNERIDNIELKLQLITLMLDKNTKHHENT